MGAERRAHPRAPGVLGGRWSKSLHPCRIRTLSVSGCFVECLSPAKVGSHTSVEIVLPEDGPTTVMGEVVANDPFGTGFSMQFSDVSPETQAKLARAVDALFERAGSKRT